jgi:hypothetical protein
VRKHAQPYFRSARKLWYVRVNGRQVNLGPDRNDAFRNYHELMSGTSVPNSATGSLRPRVGGESVIGLIEPFLDWTQKNKAAGTYDFYVRCLTSFAKTIPRELLVSQVKPFHLHQWGGRPRALVAGNEAEGIDRSTAGVQLGLEAGPDRCHPTSARRKAPRGAAGCHPDGGAIRRRTHRGHSSIVSRPTHGRLGDGVSAPGNFECRGASRGSRECPMGVSPGRGEGKETTSGDLPHAPGLGDHQTTRRNVPTGKAISEQPRSALAETRPGVFVREDSDCPRSP